MQDVFLISFGTKKQPVQAAAELILQQAAGVLRVDLQKVSELELKCSANFHLFINVGHRSDQNDSCLTMKQNVHKQDKINRTKDAGQESPLGHESSQHASKNKWKKNTWKHDRPESTSTRKVGPQLALVEDGCG